MRRSVLILVLLMLATPLTLLAEDTPAPAPDAVATETAPASAPDAEATPAPAPAPAAAEAKPVLKVVEKAEEKVATDDPVPDDPEEIILLIKQLIEAGKSGQWAVFAGLLITLLVWLLRKFNVLAFLPEKAVPWVAAALGILGYVGVALASGLDWLSALIQGFLVGAAAVGLWEMIGKHILKSKKAEVKAEG